MQELFISLPQGAVTTTSRVPARVYPPLTATGMTRAVGALGALGALGTYGPQHPVSVTEFTYPACMQRKN